MRTCINSTKSVREWCEFSGQSRSKEEQNQCNHGLFLTLSWKLLREPKFSLHEISDLTSFSLVIHILVITELVFGISCRDNNNRLFFMCKITASLQLWTTHIEMKMIFKLKNTLDIRISWNAPPPPPSPPLPLGNATCMLNKAYQYNKL